MSDITPEKYNVVPVKNMLPDLAMIVLYFVSINGHEQVGFQVPAIDLLRKSLLSEKKEKHPMKSAGQKQTVEFTKEQFLVLMKAVYLGNWMANAWRVENIAEDYESIEDYVFSLAPQFGFGKYMEHQKVDGDKYYPTSDFENETDVYKQQKAYDEDTFWDELSHRLGEKDFFEKYSLPEIKQMNHEESFTKQCRCVDNVSQELETNGLKKIKIST